MQASSRLSSASAGGNENVDVLNVSTRSTPAKRAAKSALTPSSLPPSELDRESLLLLDKHATLVEEKLALSKTLDELSEQHDELLRDPVNQALAQRNEHLCKLVEEKLARCDMVREETEEKNATLSIVGEKLSNMTEQLKLLESLCSDLNSDKQDLQARQDQQAMDNLVSGSALVSMDAFVSTGNPQFQGGHRKASATAGKYSIRSLFKFRKGSSRRDSCLGTYENEIRRMEEEVSQMETRRLQLQGDLDHLLEEEANLGCYSMEKSIVSSFDRSV